jgi:hypothetical protein
MPQPKGPYKLITINTAPERATRLIGRMVEALKDVYIIEHVKNCECKYHLDPIGANVDENAAIDEVGAAMKEYYADVLVGYLLQSV